MLDFNLSRVGYHLRRKALKPKPDFRTCLKCGERFHSRGPGNRICESCTCKNVEVYDGTKTVYGGEESDVMESGKRRKPTTVEGE